MGKRIAVLFATVLAVTAAAGLSVAGRGTPAEAGVGAYGAE